MYPKTYYRLSILLLYFFNNFLFSLEKISTFRKVANIV